MLAVAEDEQPLARLRDAEVGSVEFLDRDEVVLTQTRHQVLEAVPSLHRTHVLQDDPARTHLLDEAHEIPAGPPALGVAGLGAAGDRVMRAFRTGDDQIDPADLVKDVRSRVVVQTRRDHVAARARKVVRIGLRSDVPGIDGADHLDAGLARAPTAAAAAAEQIDTPDAHVAPRCQTQRECRHFQVAR